MTRAPSRVLDPSDYYDGLPGTLWKPANLPRLPSNAPAELKIHTVDIDDDPKKVYVLYRAQRRHGFQDLVQRYCSLFVPCDYLSKCEPYNLLHNLDPKNIETNLKTHQI